MATKRLYEFDPLTQQVLGKAFAKIKDLPRDGVVRHFAGLVKFRDNIYRVEFDFVFKHEYLSIENEKTTLHDRSMIYTGETIQ